MTLLTLNAIRPLVDLLSFSLKVINLKVIEIFYRETMTQDHCVPRPILLSGNPIQSINVRPLLIFFMSELSENP